MPPTVPCTFTFFSHRLYSISIYKKYHISVLAVVTLADLILIKHYRPKQFSVITNSRFFCLHRAKQNSRGLVREIHHVCRLVECTVGQGTLILTLPLPIRHTGKQQSLKWDCTSVALCRKSLLSQLVENWKRPPLSF